MPGKGFLVRGTLMPNMGSSTSYKEQGKTIQSFPTRRVVVRKSSSRTENRIPSSISLRRNNGA
jgi:hypothetical protein